MKTVTYLKKLSRSASRSIRRLLRHLTGKSIVSATLTLSIPRFTKLELGFKQESSSTGRRIRLAVSTLLPMVERA